MISFTLSIIALIIGYFLYGRFVERVFGPDDRVTPAVSKADGLDYIVMPGWKIFMIQFLNIAGTGPIYTRRLMAYYAVRLPYMLDLLVQGRLPEDALQQLPKVIG